MLPCVAFRGDSLFFNFFLGYFTTLRKSVNVTECILFANFHDIVYQTYAIVDQAESQVTGADVYGLWKRKLRRVPRLKWFYFIPISSVCLSFGALQLKSG